MTLDTLKSKYIQAIYKTKALLIKEEPITLQSGKKSHIYLNHRNFLSQHQYLALVANIYQQLTTQIEGDYILGAVDSIMSPIIVGAMSVMFNYNYTLPSLYSNQEYKLIKNNIVLIDDMTSTGETLIAAAQKIREKGGSVKYAIISAYRETTAIQNLHANGIKILSIISFAEILTSLAPLLSTKEKEIIKQNPLIMDKVEE